MCLRIALKLSSVLFFFLQNCLTLYLIPLVIVCMLVDKADIDLQ